MEKIARGSSRWLLETAYWANYCGRWREADKLLFRVIRMTVKETEDGSETLSEHQKSK